MEVVLLLFLLAGASHGIETSCDARQNGSQCYGALNGTVYLHLTDKISGYHIALTGDHRKRVFKTKSGNIVYYNKKNEETTDRRIYFEKKNGTLRINKIKKDDSDNYTLKTTQGNSRNIATHTLQLFIEAPVSSHRQVISECLPQGGMRMSCSCEGDSPRYSWTLDGQALNDSRVVHDEERSSVTLERGTVGKLTCTINNHISQATVDMDVSTCNDMIVIVAGSVAGVLLLAVLLGIYFVLCRKKTAASAEDEGEVTYADVRFVKKNQERQKKKKQAPVEVEYGEVKVSGAAGRQEESPRGEVEYGEVMIMTRPGRKVDKPQEECVYSSVR
ncbi:T-cell surface antigen CD2 isoform X5 [Osmerus eperlanus]|uniref:T-cell surface antigen CD2 isoform X5 n=1 Tax=Osmerus eperlanus TaxID=29151 RepID=UPI002E0D9B2A